MKHKTSNKQRNGNDLLAVVSLSYMDFSLDNLQDEIWIDVPNYDGMYQCSSFGRVKSLKREYYRKGDSKPRYTREIIMKQTPIMVRGTKSKVLYLSFRVEGVRKTFTVNQLIGMTFLGGLKKNECYQHKNKNSLDNRLCNIERVSHTLSKKNDFKHNKREVHNFKSFKKFTKRKYRIKCNGVEMSYSDILKKYGRSAYFNILRGNNVRNNKWTIDVVN
jgi:hypothetical protein